MKYDYVIRKRGKNEFVHVLPNGFELIPREQATTFTSELRAEQSMKNLGLQINGKFCVASYKKEVEPKRKTKAQLATASERLKPCPSCGCKAKVQDVSGGGFKDYYNATCTRCGMMTMATTTIKQVMITWNRRKWVNCVTEKLEPLTCSKCEGTNVFKNKKKIICDDCSTVFEDGKEKPKDKESFPASVNPKISMGDYIEGTEGVHQYSSSFMMGRNNV